MSSQSETLTATPDHPRAADSLPLVVIPLLSTAFGAIQGTAIHAAAPTAIFGLIWGAGAALLAPRLVQRGARSALWADLPLVLALPLAFIVLGGALLGNLLGATPQAQLDLFTQRQFGFFFAAVHTLFEWVLLPLLIMLNWKRPTRRKLVIAAAVTFYGGRIASALYFAPHAMAWGADPGLASLEAVQQWMTLNWVRTIVQDTATALLLLLATFLPGWRGDSPASGSGSARTAAS
jgi:hypothetical protein